MGEMVERVAKALYEISPYEDAGEAIDGFQVTPGGPVKWESLVECYGDAADEWREQARAAIAAMREPTGLAIRDGMIAIETRRPECGSSREQAAACWRAMIDAALADGPATEPTR